MNDASPALRIQPGEDGTITIGEASKLLKIRSQGLRQLVCDGYIPASVKGRFPLVEVVHGYVRAQKRRVQKAEQEILSLRQQREQSWAVIQRLRYG